MQKVEFLLDGPDEEGCAELIRDLGYAAVQHYDVDIANIYCGHAPRKKNYESLQVTVQCGKGDSRYGK